ncbi:hypothetical protein VSR01_17155 [Actinacidiphila sp. DG2A-62]|uniref:hypothetical protein n=1 Tax=Actinacidiphila sp. DG2A-62 TaxID=3108821 RepID=UPI002DB9864D|nr:hypothetical protein [Actinacidiphila sp. DG2A-62]MEC3995167.1 hypothetical protein [Actinacidiphila sp. DG2A-62]
MPDRDPSLDQGGLPLHHLDLCSDCGGLRTVTLQRVPGISSVTVHDDAGAASLGTTGPAALYIGPAPEACPNAAGVGDG